jgi:hypothetical protein
MSTEENKALVRRFYEEWNKQNLSIVEELVAPPLGLPWCSTLLS